MSVKIVKIGHQDGGTPTPPPVPTVVSLPKKGGKSMKTFPRGVLKTAKTYHKKAEIKGVSDPARVPPLKKSMKKHTIRLITDKGLRRHKKTLKKKISKMSNEKVRELATKHGLLKNPNTPPAVMREMLEGGAMAGFVNLS